MGRSGFRGRRGICHRIRGVITLYDFCCNLDFLRGVIDGNLLIVQDQRVPVLAGILIDDANHLLADLVDGFITVMVEVILSVFGIPLQELLLLFRVAAQA